MGQKVCPIGFRLVRNKNWRSIWYANKKEFGRMLVEDQEVRRYLMAKKSFMGTSKIIIMRMSDKVEITVHTSRPGLVIGKGGAEIDQLKSELRKKLGKEVWIEVSEVKRPDLEGQLVAEGIAKQLERRVAFRRALKKAIQSTMDSGAHGIKVQVSGRIGGAEIARSEWYKEGRIPLHTLRADIDYGEARAETTYGTIGVKVWVNRGEVLLPKQAKQGA
jgi:small subunit ribosomal protein S3